MSWKNRTSPEKIGPLVHPDMSRKYGTGLILITSRPAACNVPVYCIHIYETVTFTVTDSVYHKDAYVQILMGNTKYMEIPNDRWSERTLTGRGPTDYGPGSEIGVGWKIGVTWSRKRGFKMAATELGYLLTKLSFWLSLWSDINFLAWRQRIIRLVWFANKAIHLWPQVMPIFDREMPPGFTPAICFSRNFVYVSILENRGDKFLDQNF